MNTAPFNSFNNGATNGRTDDDAAVAAAKQETVMECEREINQEQRPTKQVLLPLKLLMIQ